MSLSDLFTFGYRSSQALGSTEIPSIFPLAITVDDFRLADIKHTYSKILTDTIERTHGLTDDMQRSLWDNCLQNAANLGLISLLADAMARKSDLFLVYAKATKVLRKATSEEERVIREDYKQSGESKVGVFVSFKGYQRTTMLEMYSAFEYCVLASLNKKLKISQAVQIKVNELRSSVSLSDANVAIEQARAIAEALRNGNDVLVDKLDDILSATPDTATSEKAILFLNAKKSFILSLPLAYISGEQTGGIGSTGENDMRAVERGLKQFFTSVIQPVTQALFGVKVEFMSQDFRGMTTALEVLKTFELSSDESLLDSKEKRKILARVFELNEEV